MSAASAPVAVQIQALAQPIEARLEEGEIQILRQVCIERHEKNGEVINTLIGLATLVAGVWAGLLIGGFAGFLVAVATMSIGGNALRAIYNHLRDSTYADIATALKTAGFRRFIANRNYDLSIEAIPQRYLTYRVLVGNL